MHRSVSFNVQPVPAYKISVQSNIYPVQRDPKKKFINQSQRFLELPLSSQKSKLHTNFQSLLTINQNVSNIQTMALSNNVQQQNEEGKQNFSSSYYLNSYRNKVDNDQLQKLSTIMQKYKQGANSAQELAKELYQKFFYNKLKQSSAIQQNFETVQARVSQMTEKQHAQKNKQKLQHKNLVKTLYSNLKEVVQHILNKEGESKFERLNQKLQDKEDANLDGIRHCKLDTNDDVLENIQLLRVLLSKKTDEYEILKEIESSLKLDSDNNTDLLSEFKEASEFGLDTSVVLSDKQQKLSRFTEAIQKQKEKDDQSKIQKYFNIDELKNQWHTDNEEKIKKMMHRTLVRDTLAFQERQLIKRGGKKKITKEETLAQATFKQGISQFAITKNQLVEQQEKDHQAILIIQSQPVLKKMKNIQNYNQITNIFSKLHQIEQEEQNKKKKQGKSVNRRASSLHIMKEVVLGVQPQKKKSDAFQLIGEQSTLGFMRKSLDYSDMFMKRASGVK